MNKEQALEILKENVKNENLRRHHYAAAAAMRALAEQLGGDPGTWEIVGLLQDADYEETNDAPERHALVIAEKLEGLENSKPPGFGTLEDVIRAIKAHNYEYTNVRPESRMEWSLVACDDLTGLIVAVALVHPEKLSGVTVESVMKKFSSKSFAAGADRERIKMCEEKLGIPLEKFVGIVLEAMQGIAEQLGL